MVHNLMVRDFSTHSAEMQTSTVEAALWQVKNNVKLSCVNLRMQSCTGEKVCLR